MGVFSITERCLPWEAFLKIMMDSLVVGIGFSKGRPCQGLTFRTGSFTFMQDEMVNKRWVLPNIGQHYHILVIFSRCA